MSFLILKNLYKKGIIMERPLLNDKEIYPDNEVIKKYLFDTFDLWIKFIDMLRIDYPEYNT